MKDQRRQELKRKGWTERDLFKAESILEQREKAAVHFSRIVFWSALLVIIIANLLVSLVFIPFLIVLNQVVLYSVIVLLAAVMGVLYNLLITDVGHLERRHHLLAGMIIPLIALINVVFMVLISNRFILALGVDNPQHSPLISGVIFAAAFIAPSILQKVFGSN